ncbi:MAG: tail assembly protein [Moraxella sp.]|nr:tail assembly protein [Moraxella sp.]
MKTIILHGILAKRFGRYFKLDVKTAKEATHAIACQIPAFKRFMLDSERMGLKFAVFVGKKRTQATNISERELDHITTTNTIHIMPRLIGSGGKVMGWLQVIAGVAMVAVGAFTVNPALIAAGVGMALGGVASLLMPTPNTDYNQAEDGNRPSKGFGGAVTTTEQGNPVPVLYGERLVGGFFASGGMYVEDTV